MGYSTVVFTLCLLFCTTVYSSKAPCPPCNCDKDCACGYRYDENGCKVCQCRPCVPPHCGAICAMACPCGFVRDQWGCPICKCKKCGVPPHCSGAICLLPCPCGFVRDQWGCPICKCKKCGKNYSGG